MVKGDDIEERLIEFAVRIVKLSTALPGSTAGKHIADQVLRSGTAPAGPLRRSTRRRKPERLYP